MPITPASMPSGPAPPNGAPPTGSTNVQQPGDRWIEYTALLDKALRKFSGLRDCPTHGPLISASFTKAFSVFQRLWSHQQQHRQVRHGGSPKCWLKGFSSSHAGVQTAEAGLGSRSRGHDHVLLAFRRLWWQLG